MIHQPYCIPQRLSAESNNQQAQGKKNDHDSNERGGCTKQAGDDS